MIKILVVDDHEIMRKGLRTLFDQEDDFTVVGEARNGEEALLTLETETPDIVLMDVKMPDRKGTDVALDIKNDYPDAKVVMLSAFGDSNSVNQALKADVDGYLLKDTSSEELINELKIVYERDHYIQPVVAKKIMENLTRYTQEPVTEHNLTDRELKVLQLITDGNKNREIAAKLFLGEETVKTHVSNILCKLGLSDRTQAALYAIRQGLVEDLESDDRDT